MSGEMARLYARGVYLLRGGSSKDFDDLNDEDIQLMLAVDDGMRMRQVKVLMSMFGVKEQ